MEYVPGDTLEAVIEREGTLDLARALDYTCQICNAMDHAHRHGIIHRDLRPGNVLVTDQGLIKVADFGTSRFLEIAAHGTTVIGSPPYMAPEQFQGKAVFASDIYSLGVTMYQMLTGVLPYDTPMPADLDRLMRGELASPPKLKNPKLPKAISDIVMKAIAADIPSRYPARGRSARGRARRARAVADPPPVAAGAGRGHRPPRPPRTCRTSTRASKRAKPCRRDSAGSAARRCRRAPTSVRSALKSNNK